MRKQSKGRHERDPNTHTHTFIMKTPSRSMTTAEKEREIHTRGMNADIWHGVLVDDSDKMMTDGRRGRASILD